MARDRRLEYRNDGFLYAYKFMEEHTLEDLEREIKNRNRTGITMNRFHDSVIVAPTHDELRDSIYQGQDLIFLAVLRAKKFGKTRLERNLKYVRDRRRNTFIGAYDRMVLNQGRLKGFAHGPDNKDILRINELIPKINRDLDEYIRIRNEGIDRAVQIVKESGMTELYKQITSNKFCEKMAIKEDEYCTKLVKIYFNMAASSDWLVSLHENEGFGNKRLNDIVDGFERTNTAIYEHRILGYDNYRQMVSQALGYEFECKALEDSPLYKFVSWDKVVDKLKPKEEKPKKKKKKKKQKEVVEESVTIIEEPQEFEAYPCLKCKSKDDCRKSKYRNKCVCLNLYKEFRIEKRKGKE